MLQIRVADGSLRRLVGKCLRVGVLDGEQRTEPERGVPQGSGLSPLLGNVYLHYTLDVWFEREVKPRIWLKWLCRRSQRTRLTWERYKRLLARFPLPRPRVVVQIWGV